MSPDFSRLVDTWADEDRGRALHHADHEAIRVTESARWLVLDLIELTTPSRDLFNACSRLGHLMGEAGASPSLASATIDNAARVLADAGVQLERSRVATARASLVEGYVAAIREVALAALRSSWQYPACAVPLGNGSVAIACGHPAGDGEAMSAWASDVAGRLVKTKVRRAVLSGPDAAKAEVTSALQLVGIEVVPPADDAQSRPMSWFRLPWSK